MAFFRLGQVLDIEWLLQRDEGRSVGDLAAHDRRLLAGQQPADAEHVLALWLNGRRAELDQRTLGVRVSELLTGVHVVLFTLACAAGIATSEALLGSASSREPTNVLHYAFATVVWPLGFLFASLLLLLGRGRLGRSVLLEDAYLLLLGAANRLLARGAAEGELAGEWRRLRRSARRYRDIEVGTLLAAAQWYPLGFHLGAAASLSASALFSDLAFAWSTTDGSLSPDTVAAFARALTAPWCGLLGVGCVSPELVRATQFSRFTGEYAAPAGALLSGAWWPALLACLLAYGALPRLLFGLGVRAVVARRSARLSERVLELRGRLRAGVEVEASSPPVRVERVVGAPLTPVPVPAPGLAARECWVIHWRGAQLAEEQLLALCHQLGLRAVREDVAGGSDYEADRALIEASGPAERALLLLVEGWEAPDKATRRFMEELRARGSAERPIFVGVLGAAEPELLVWRQRLQLLEDPFLSVQAVSAARVAERTGSAR